MYSSDTMGSRCIDYTHYCMISIDWSKNHWNNYNIWPKTSTEVLRNHNMFYPSWKWSFLADFTATITTGLRRLTLETKSQTKIMTVDDYPVTEHWVNSVLSLWNFFIPNYHRDRKLGKSAQKCILRDNLLTTCYQSHFCSLTSLCTIDYNTV